MNLREALRQAEERLVEAEIADAKNDAWLLLEHVTGISRAKYFLSPEAELPVDKQETLFRLVEERAKHRPLQHITGNQTFMGLDFHVNEHVLIPRQDTEILVEKAIGILEDRFKDKSEDKIKSETAGRKAEIGKNSEKESQKANIAKVSETEKRKANIAKVSETEKRKANIAKVSGTEKRKAEIEKAFETEKRPAGISEKPEAKFRILDLCTGSGCIAVSLAVWSVRNDWPVEITATDISVEALRVARGNADTIMAEELREVRGKSAAVDGPDAGNETETVDGPDAGNETETVDGPDAGTGTETDASLETEFEKEIIRFLRGDLFDATGVEKFSMILSNPPYIRTEEIETLMPEVRDFEPRLALDGAEDGLAFYRRIVSEAPAHLEPGGMLLLEIGFDEARAVSDMIQENGFRDICVWKDYAGLDRVVYGEYDPT